MQRPGRAATLRLVGGSARHDRELVGAFLDEGDEEAFRELFRRHSPALYAFCLRLGGPTLAEDAVQETWMRAARGLSQFAWRSSLRTWLTGIALNCVREALREATPLEGIGEAEIPAPASPRSGDLEEALHLLPSGYRQVLVLHDIQGYTHEEIADHMGIDPGTSRSQLSRARRALRALWEQGAAASKKEEHV